MARFPKRRECEAVERRRATLYRAFREREVGFGWGGRFDKHLTSTRTRENLWKRLNFWGKLPLNIRIIPAQEVKDGKGFN
jgi:hypothetical protein